jgi:hypothetical protein
MRSFGTACSALMTAIIARRCYKRSITSSMRPSGDVQHEGVRTVRTADRRPLSVVTRHGRLSTRTERLWPSGYTLDVTRNQTQW